MNLPGAGDLPPSYRSFRVLLTVLLTGALIGLLAAGGRHNVPAWLWQQAVDVCRSVRDGLLPW